ncbi:MAG: CHAD domain-containing protein [Solirubrobacteraceae bacterium]
MAYKFETDESVREAIQRTADEQLANAVEQLRSQIQDDPVKAVHSARKAVKKERALLRLSRDATRPAKRRRQNVALRDAGRALSETRDAEVFVQALDALSERYTGQVPDAAFAAFRERLDVDRQDARRRLSDPTLAAEVADELEATRQRISQWSLRHRGWSAIEGGLDRTYRQGRRAFRRARSKPDVERLHEWRKRSKDLWYELRLLAPVGGEAVRGQVKAAHLLADLLGDDHDLAVLREKLTELSDEVAADLDAVLGLLDHRREQLQSEAMHVGAQVYAESPKAFAKRMHRSWRAGRARAMAQAAHDDPGDLAQVTRAVAAA